MAVTVTLCIQEEEEALRGERKCDLWSGNRPPRTLQLLP